MCGGNPSTFNFLFERNELPFDFRSVSDGLSNTLFVSEKHLPTKWVHARASGR